MDNNNPQRAAFEALAVKRGLKIERLEDYPEEYVSSLTAAAWDFFQSGIEHAITTIPTEPPAERVQYALRDNEGEYLHLSYFKDAMEKTHYTAIRYSGYQVVPVQIIDLSAESRPAVNLAELALMLRRLISKLPADHPMKQEAINFLVKRSLQGSPLRALEVPLP